MSAGIKIKESWIDIVELGGKSYKVNPKIREADVLPVYIKTTLDAIDNIYNLIKMIYL